MPISSRNYASLSDDAYIDRKIGWRDPESREAIELDGTGYDVLAHIDNRKSGYQSTIYQHKETGGVVVAHRGTEFDRQLIKDGLLADGSMVVGRANPQIADAIELTRMALQYAEVQQGLYGRITPVTVTGHSLGGALAQASAHHFDLKGETFNAYGAASLGYRIPEGGNAVVNHVMATDPVSAAARHYGQVRVYASEQELTVLRLGGFSNSRLNALIPDTVMGVAVNSFESHKMHNFLDKDAEGRPDRSVLLDPRTRQRAEDNQRMIAEYRTDVHDLREDLTRGVRGPAGRVMDYVNELRGPREAGEPARRESPVTGAPARPRLDDERHGGFSLFRDAERGVREQDARVGRTPDQQSRQLAGALAAQMHAAGGRRIDAVMMSTDAERTFAIQGRLDDPAHLRVHVPTMAALQTSLEESTQRMDRSLAQQPPSMAQEQAQQVERQQDGRTRAMA